jgi:hypothetical protein
MGAPDGRRTRLVATGRLGRPWLAHAVILAALAVVLALFTQPRGTTDPAAVESASPSASVALTHYAGVQYEGGRFSFDYPASWRFLVGDQHWGLHGSSVGVALGIGRFDLGCSAIPPSGDSEGGVSCPGQPTWQVPEDGVVLAYYSRPRGPVPPVGPTATPDLAPGEELAMVDGRPAAKSETPISVVWQLNGGIEIIEARFGPANAGIAGAQVDALIATWRWE